jgi:cell division protein FtsI (penicillin-binding protein 3)
VVTQPKKEIGFYGNVVAAPVFKELRDNLYAEEAIDTPNLKGKPAEAYTGMVEELNEIHELLSYPTDVNAQKNTWMKSNDSILEAYDFIEGAMPDVIGMAAMDALFLLENMGLEVEIQGKGKVVKQSLKAGNKVSKNQKVALRLAS